jgi:hypothetical protein
MKFKTLLFKLGFILGAKFNLLVFIATTLDVIRNIAIHHYSSIILDVICYSLLMLATNTRNFLRDIAQTNLASAHSLIYIVNFVDKLLEEENERQKEEGEFEKLITTYRQSKGEQV